MTQDTDKFPDSFLEVTPEVITDAVLDVYHHACQTTMRRRSKKRKEKEKNTRKEKTMMKGRNTCPHRGMYEDDDPVVPQELAPLPSPGSLVRKDGQQPPNQYSLIRPKPPAALPLSIPFASHPVSHPVSNLPLLDDLTLDNNQRMQQHQHLLLKGSHQHCRVLNLVIHVLLNGKDRLRRRKRRCRLRSGRVVGGTVRGRGGEDRFLEREWRIK